MNIQKVTHEVDMDIIVGLRERIKHIGFTTCSTNTDCERIVIDDDDDDALDAVKEFMNDFIQSYYERK